MSNLRLEINWNVTAWHCQRIKKNVSTISREIKRNSGQRGYRFHQADTSASERRSKACGVPKKLTAELTIEIESKLKEDWSPEQISGRLKTEGIFISHASIYRYVWEDKRSGGLLYQHLRHNGKRYKKRSSGKAGRSCIPDRVDIAERPIIVDEKSRIGDWEGDTVISSGSKTAILTVVDRCSKYTLIKN